MHQLHSLLKKRLVDSSDCVRLLHGRGKLWPEFAHLSIDFYPPHILITTYKEIDQNEKDELVKIICDLPGIKLESIILQKRYVKNEAVEVLWGTNPSKAFAVENSEKYIINFDNTQNIGFFLDMAVGREIMRKISKDKKILNLFSYTCSLSVAALKGGASEVVNVDMSKSALKRGEENHLINGIDKRLARFVPHDIMKSFGNIARKGPYDIIIIDPPTNQGESFNAEKEYHKIVRRLPEMTNAEGLVFACLNSPRLGSEFLLEIFKEHAPGFLYQDKHYSSFHEMESNPEEGLKILVFKKL
jgi:23S rRNA (cytosine1962-C5)-methyltransferase